jgi:hypothetical protein
MCVWKKNAVWSESGKVIFARENPNMSPDRGLGHIVDKPDSQSMEINAVSLDDYSERNGPPEFIKCDVEGAESKFLRERVLCLNVNGLGLCASSTATGVATLCSDLSTQCNIAARRAESVTFWRLQSKQNNGPPCALARRLWSGSLLAKLIPMPSPNAA